MLKSIFIVALVVVSVVHGEPDPEPAADPAPEPNASSDSEPHNTVQGFTRPVYNGPQYGAFGVATNIGTPLTLTPEMIEYAYGFADPSMYPAGNPNSIADPTQFINNYVLQALSSNGYTNPTSAYTSANSQPGSLAARSVNNNNVVTNPTSANDNTPSTNNYLASNPLSNQNWVNNNYADAVVATVTSNGYTVPSVSTNRYTVPSVSANGYTVPTVTSNGYTVQSTNGYTLPTTSTNGYSTQSTTPNRYGLIYQNGNPTPSIVMLPALAPAIDTNTLSAINFNTRNPTYQPLQNNPAQLVRGIRGNNVQAQVLNTATSFPYTTSGATYPYTNTRMNTNQAPVVGTTYAISSDGIIYPVPSTGPTYPTSSVGTAQNTNQYQTSLANSGYRFSGLKKRSAEAEPSADPHQASSYGLSYPKSHSVYKSTRRVAPAYNRYNEASARAYSRPTYAPSAYSNVEYSSPTLAYAYGTASKPYLSQSVLAPLAYPSAYGVASPLAYGAGVPVAYPGYGYAGY